jgi:hypothetical protein
MPLTLTPIEAKLLRLIMDDAAASGEVANGATMLVESLRKRGVSAEDIESAFARKGILPKYTRPDFGLTVCPFRKHKGELARDIDPSYLRFMIRWVRDPREPQRRDRFGQWADDMESFLSQQ